MYVLFILLEYLSGLAGGIYRRYLPPVFTGKYRHGQYSQKWRLPAFTGIYKYFINFSSNYIVDSPSYLDITLQCTCQIRSNRNMAPMRLSELTTVKQTEMTPII